MRNALTREFVDEATANTANHIFGAKRLADHKLSGLLGAFNGNGVKATRALQRATQALADAGKIAGQFQSQVTVKGFNVTVRGRVIGGKARLSTAFIP